MKNFILFVLLLMAGPGNPAAASSSFDGNALPWQGFPTYCNDRYAYCIRYPAGILTPKPESSNGDGRIFVNKAGAEALRVWGFLNEGVDGNTISIDKQFETDKALKEKEGFTITYKLLKKDFFVLSGKKNGKVFYQKTIVQEESFATALATGKQEQEADFKTISEAISGSFR